MAFKKSVNKNHNDNIVDNDDVLYNRHIDASDGDDVDVSKTSGGVGGFINQSFYRLSFRGSDNNDDVVVNNSVADVDVAVISNGRNTGVPRRRRLVEKNGCRNVRSSRIPHERYMQDVFTTLIDAKWKWVILLFLVVYLGSWLMYAIIWYIIIVAHSSKCLDNVDSFTQAFLLAVETSMTIGYGGRAVSDQCPEAVIFLVVQALLSLIIDALILGMVFTKIARPGKRTSTVVFSRHGVVTKRDDKFCIMFRVADVRKRQLSECHVRLYLYRTYKTLEGKIIHNHQDQLRVGCDWWNIRDDSDRLFLLSPCTVSHVIDRKSPFYSVSRDAFNRLDWELVVVLEGVVEATGSTVQARTSYLLSEISWGYDFVDLLSDEWEEETTLKYKIRRLDDKEAVPYVPSCSPRNYYISIDHDPDPNDVVGEQDELWDDENFIPLSLQKRVISTHKTLADVLA